PLDVRDPLRSLERELESGRHVGHPSLYRGGAREGSKRVVTLDRAELLAVIPEHLLGRQFFRVERAFPFLVGIAARADVQVHASLSGASGVCCAASSE